ncbi:MAG: hypothetical protein IKP84_07640 [Prevotella sp.]|nr:hypothetical protein [Prevotella sp.]
MSINLKDSNVIRCLSYNPHASMTGFSDKLADKIAAKTAKMVSNMGNGTSAQDKSAEETLSYFEGFADIKEIYAGWNGFKICESQSCPDYRFVFFQEEEGGDEERIRLICVEKGVERRFVVGIIFDGNNRDEDTLKEYKDVCAGTFIFEVDEKEIGSIEKISGDSIIWADHYKKGVIILFSVPDSFVKNIVKSDSNIRIRYMGKKTYTIYLGDDNNWYTRYELEREGMHTVINYEEWRENNAKPIWRETSVEHANKGYITFEAPDGWDSLYKEIKKGKMAEYAKSMETFKEKFPLLAQYGITKKRAIIYMAILCFLLLGFIDDAIKGHNVSAYIVLFIVFGGVIMWLHKPKK